MLALILGVVVSWFSPTVCSSTIFGYAGDGHGGRSPTILTKKPVTDADVGIAHRTWKMGTVVKVKNLRTGKVATGVVLDRGPYGKLTADGEWFNGSPGARKKRAKKGEPEPVGEYRGCADLTPSLAKLIRHNGRDRIRIWRRR